MNMSSQEIDNDLFTRLSNVNVTASTYDVTTSCKITTMTILLWLNGKIPLHQITDSNLNDILEKKSAFKCTTSVTKKFNNCIIVKCTGDRNVTVKIFSNGNLHMTGTKSADMAMSYGQLFCCCLSELFGQSFCITSLTIQLINACCRFNLDFDAVLSSNAFQNCVSESRDIPDVLCLYNNDHHAGLRVKIPYQVSNGSIHTCTCIIFSSGSVLFNAFLSGKELVHAYNFITRIFLQNKAMLITPKLKKHVYEADFDYNQYL